MDKIYVKNIIQQILNKEFPNSAPRRKIHEYTDRLQLCCFFCGDSKNEYKHRGNLYLRNLFFICFNCGHKCSFDRICKDHNIIIDPQKKLEIIEYLNNNINYSNYESDFVDTKLDNLVDLNDLINVFNVKKITPIYDFEPIKKGGGVYKYLIGRGIPENLHKNIYQAKFSKGEEGFFDHIIIFLNKKDDKVLGMQIRNLKEGKRRFFLIYNWENIYKFVHGEDVDLDINQTIIYNKLSAFFNILNVDFSETITVFEGFIDSLFYPNSLGLCGVNSDVKFLENNNLDLQYFFDNDIAGFKKSEEKLNDGYRIFLWIKLFEDIVSKKKTDDPYKLYNRISKVKDLNKLNELVPNAYLKLKLGEFFSQDKFDIKYIPKEKKKKFEKDYNKKFKYNDF